MSIVASTSSQFPILKRSNRRHSGRPKVFISPVSLRDDSRTASRKEDEIAVRSEPSVLHRIGIESQPSDLRFDRLQPSDGEYDCKHKRGFGRYVAREALIDEEIWTAAWLRAESHWEDKSNMRHVDSFKRQFAQQEFNAIKRRCSSRQVAEKFTCIIVVKKEETNVKRSVLSSIVGTLDINIRRLLYGETFPGEHMKGLVSCSIFGKRDQPLYGYISNLSVAKYARRQGIASNMLLLAVDAAKSYGVDELYVHVHKDNMAARKLYEKWGFEMVEKAMSQSSGRPQVSTLPENLIPQKSKHTPD